jgi:uncharacterized repeat protein (TIGR01451 family)
VKTRYTIGTVALVAFILLAIAGRFGVSAQPEPPPPTATSDAGDGGMRILDGLQGTTEPAAEAPITGNVPLDTSPLPETPEAPANPEQAAPRTKIFSADAAVAVDTQAAPITVRAGDLVTYTYFYTNTSGATISDLQARVVWTYMSPTEPSGFSTATIHQVCASSCETVNVTGPAVARGTGVAGGYFYTIGSINNGQSGQFSIVMRMLSKTYPKTGEPPTRPGTSVEMMRNAAPATTIVSDTATSLVVGPVLTLRKVVSPNHPSSITILDTVDFRITIGNAYLPADQSNGQPRADAIAATDIVIIDQIPVGGEYVPLPDPPGIVSYHDTGSQVVSYTIALLPVGQSRTFTLRIRKHNIPLTGFDNGCSYLRNATYNVTANEYPFKEPGLRYVVDGPTASISVYPALSVYSLTFADQPIVFGEVTTATVVVANRFNLPVTGAQLRLRFPPLIGYVPGTANPSTISAGGVYSPGGTANWTFNIGAGTAITPALYTMTMKVRAAFIDPLPDPSAYLPLSDAVGHSFVVPSNSGIPTTCMVDESTYVTTQPRLTIEIAQLPSGAPRLLDGTNPLSIELKVRNNSKTAVINGVVVTGELPTRIDYPANFTYVPGSGRVDGQPVEPQYVNGDNGWVRWNNLTMQPNSIRLFRFAVRPGGTEYIDYCLQGATDSPEDPVKRTGVGSVGYAVREGICVKLNPPVDMKKTAFPGFVRDSSTEAGREITFTLRITNNSALARQMSLADRMGSFEYVRQVPGSSNNGSPTYTNDSAGRRLTWNLQTVQPGGALYAEVVLRVPEGCPDIEYTNEIAFRIETTNNQVIYVVREVPEVVRVPCAGKIEFSKRANPSAASQYDRVVYTLRLVNRAPGLTVNSIVITDLLPSGFTYEGMDTSSGVLATPQISAGPSGRQMLQWNIAALGPNLAREVIFIARTSTNIGVYENFAWLSTPTLVELNCNGFSPMTCRNETINGVVQAVAVFPVNVEPMTTLEPSLDNTACAAPGAIRRYRLAIVNTNSHGLTNTTVRIRIPAGNAVISADNTASPGIVTLPSITAAPNGDTFVGWTQVNVPERPSGQSAAQLTFFVDVRVGLNFIPAAITADATSDDGLILIKDGVIEPLLITCVPTGASIYKFVDQTSTLPGGALNYRILFVNPTTQTITTNVVDEMPAGMTFGGMTIGAAPTQNGRMLTWNNIQAPSSAGGIPGVVELRFTGVVPTNAQAGVISNIAGTSGTVPVDNGGGVAETRVDTQPTPIPTVAGAPTATPGGFGQPTATPPPNATNLPAPTRDPNKRYVYVPVTRR